MLWWKSNKYYILCMFVALGIQYLKRQEVTGERRKLHNEELNDLYSLPNTVRVV
jgi:hypothetical protein